MAAYYNEIDPFAAAWLRELIKANLIAEGEVDERSIEQVEPADLQGFTQCHFFAGIGVWSYALRAAGWPDDTPVWTGSCPCQSFSAGGKRGGFSDKRHLWPSWFRLISECRPATIFGEQVASKDGRAWYDVVSADMEGAGYAIGEANLGAHSVGAPHIRQRLFFVAHAEHAGLNRPSTDAAESCSNRQADGLFERSDSGLRGTMVNPSGSRYQGDMASEVFGERDSTLPEPRPGEEGDAEVALHPSNRIAIGATNGFWRDAEWIYCRDQKWRPVESGVAPLVNGTSSRMGRGSDSGAPINAKESAEARVMRLRGYGNAINVEVAKAFIEAYMELD